MDTKQIQSNCKAPSLQPVDDPLLQSARLGDNSAMERMLNKYRHLVRNMVQNFYVRGAEADDLLQVGMIGLWQAVTDYLPEKKISFNSFAKVCIERHLITAIKSYSRKKHSFLNDAISLEQYIEPQDTGLSFNDILASSPMEVPEAILLEKEQVDSLKYFVQTLLSEFEWNVFMLHHKGSSYIEISNLLGCNTKAVDNALGRIKRKLSCCNCTAVT